MSNPTKPDTENLRPYMKEVAPEPLWDVPVTVDAVLKNMAAVALVIGAENHRHITGARHASVLHQDLEMSRYLQGFYHHTGAWNLHLTLSALNDADPAKAQEIAEWIYAAYDGGDAYGEWAWQWCQEHGMDPKRLQDENAPVVDLWQQKMSERLQGPDSVALEVITERARQVEKGYTHEHDDQHGAAGIARVATTYIDPDAQTVDRVSLVKAAALLVAAIEELDRRTVTTEETR
jgi:hypothetical protein